jgi:drug/metabolite transporter (DMT)-like permease
VERRLGILTGLVATLMWGTQFPISSELFPRVDPYVQSPLRYSAAALLLALVVLAVEGPASLRFGGQGRRAFFVGGIGVFGGVFIVYVGVQHSRPQDAALVVAFQPIITAIILRARGGPRIPHVTLASILVGLVGILFVITHGHPLALADGQVRWGLALVLLGQMAWAYYTIEMTSFAGWSVLRVATLTAATGSLWMIAGMLIAWWIGLAHPSAAGVWDERWRMAYITVGPTMLSLLAWARTRSSLGAQNTALFINVVPITAFVYAIVQGYRPNGLEVLGVAIAIGALVANNLLTRSTWGPRPGADAQPSADAA